MEVRDTRMGVNYGLGKVRFPAPVPVGSRLRGHFKLTKFEPIDGGATPLNQRRIMTAVLAHQTPD